MIEWLNLIEWVDTMQFFEKTEPRKLSLLFKTFFPDDSAIEAHAYC